MATGAKDDFIHGIARDVKKDLGDKVSDGLVPYRDYAKEAAPLEWISTGNYAINRILGGGVPVGRAIEIFGPFSGGKSLLLYEIMAQVMKQGGWCILEDTEATFDEKFGESIGMNMDRLLYSQPDTVEDVFLHAEAGVNQIRKRDKDCLICIGWDSLAQTSTRAEMLDGEKRDFSKAQVIGRGLRRLMRMFRKQRTIFIVINQIREKIGVMFGNPETTPGGNAVPFAATQRIRVQHGSLYKGHPKNIKDGVRVIAVRIVVDCVKNKIAPPFRKCEAITSFTNGIVAWSGLVELLADEGVLKVLNKEKGIYSWKNEEFKATEIEGFLEQHPDLVYAEKD